MSSAPPKQRIQTVQDFAITSQLWQDHLAVKIAPLLTDFFVAIYRSCLNYAEAVMAESGEVVDPIEHFARAVEALDMIEHTESLDRIIEQLPELSTAFKTFFVAQAWVLTSVRLQQNAGSVSPALMATLPTKRKIVSELIDEAGTVFLGDPELITKPRRAISKKLRKTVPVGLLRLIQGSDFMDTFLKAMKTENRFAPSAVQPPPRQMAADSIAATESIQEPKRRRRHRRRERPSSSSSSSESSSSSSSSESETESEQKRSGFEIVEKDEATGIVRKTSGEFQVDPKTDEIKIDSSSIVETEEVPEPEPSVVNEIGDAAADSVIDEL
jgi:hypothetical protein